MIDPIMKKEHSSFFSHTRQGCHNEFYQGKTKGNMKTFEGEYSAGGI